MNNPRDNAHTPLAGLTPRADRPEAVERLLQGAHHTLDTLADGASSQIHHLKDKVDEAGNALHRQAEHLRSVREHWTASARACVREHPLTSVATALGVGALLALLLRR